MARWKAVAVALAVHVLNSTPGQGVVLVAQMTAAGLSQVLAMREIAGNAP